TDMLGCPHLVLTNIGGDDGIVVGRRSNFLDDGIRLWPIRSILQRSSQHAILLALDPRAPGGVLACFHLWSQEFENLSDITHNWHIGMDVLPDFGRIDVDVNDLGVRSKAGEIAG